MRITFKMAEKYNRGIHMNLSEREVFDVFIPDHPLSEARRFVSEITKMN